MITIGEFLKKSRTDNKKSRTDLSKETKIKVDFIMKIENNQWDSLPEYPIVSGFVKNIAINLNVPEQKAQALLRRDYPPKKLNINPKPDLENKLSWTPKISFIVGIVFVCLLILGYLGIQYYKFISPPLVHIDNPQNNQIIFENKLLVKGKTTSDVVVTINNQQAIVDKDGNFEAEISVNENTSQLSIVATSRSGKSTQVYRTIKVDIDN